MEEPPRKLLLVTPVLQVVSKESARDRTLFLFSDVLIIAKCMTAGEGGLIMDKSFVVKTIIELKRCSGPICSAGSRDLSNDRRSPFLQSFVSEFQNDQSKAVAMLCDAVGVQRDEAAFIGDILFRTHELSRSAVGDYLAKRNNRDILHAFVDKFNFSGVRLDHALRIFLLSILLSDKAEPRSLENLLAGFSARWFHANNSMVAFDKECAKNLVVSIVLLNASLHMPYAHSQPPATPQDFFDAVRAYDQRHSIKDDLLEDIYEAVKQEKISAPKENPGEVRLAVTITGATNPMHFTYRVKSDVVRVRIPAPDPNFRIHLRGQDVLFEPPTLHFADSSEATFRVTGTSLGSKSILYWRAGANAHLYNDMPLASDIIIERAFMRNTLRLEVKEPTLGLDRDSLMEDSDQGSTKGRTKKQYVFSIEDSREYDHWAKVLRTSINRALGIMDPERPPTAQGLYTPVTATFDVPPRIRRAADTVAFEVLKETLIGHKSGSIVSRVYLRMCP
jgi:serine/arginine repetitive matrix protein 2